MFSRYQKVIVLAIMAQIKELYSPVERLRKKNKTESEKNRQKVESKQQKQNEQTKIYLSYLNKRKFTCNLTLFLCI